MIPILYESIEGTNSSPFVTNGIGGLGDAVSCVVACERNGSYELVMEYPVDGIHFEEIKPDRLILAKPDETSTNQIFRIYQVEKPIDNVSTIYAEHISYLLNKVVVLPFTAYSASSAFSEIRTHLQWNSQNTNFSIFPFTFWTDITGTGTCNIESPMSVRAALAGTEGGILDAFNGEYEFDNFTVKLHSQRGYDNDVVLRYGKNITKLLETDDISTAYTGVMAYWKGELDKTSPSLDADGNVVTEKEDTVIYLTQASQSAYIAQNPTVTNYLNDKTLWSSHDVDYAYPLSMPLDLSSIELDDYAEPELTQGDTETDVAFANRLKAARIASENAYSAYVLSEVTKRANEYLTNNTGWKPANNIKISFVQLWNTEEYKDVAVLERVSLCDRVSVYYPDFDISVKVKVVKTEYNVLLDRYNSIELGDAIQSAADNLVSGMSKLQADFNKALEENSREIVSDYRAAVSHATDLIRGGLGGYLVINTNAAGQPNELLIMDRPSKSTAVNVWRFNEGGLGHSHSGYDGPFDDVALTKDGQINATMITTGTLNATVIRAGRIQDTKGYNYWDLDSGEFSLASTATIDGKTIASTDYVDNLDVGGRNYIINTLIPDVSATAKRPKIYQQSGNTVFSAGTYSTSTHGFRITNTEATRTSIRFGTGTFSSGSLHGLTAGKTYTLSFDYSTKLLSGTLENDTTYYFRAYLYADNEDHSAFANRFYKTFATIEPSSRGGIFEGTAKFTFTISDTDTAMHIYIACTCSTSAAYAIGDYIELKNIMLEEGSVATSWTAAPEDYISYSDTLVSDSLTDYDTNLNQAKVFNKLTSNGTIKGLYMKDGQLYVNASYIASGTLKLGGASNTNGLLQVFDANDVEIGRWSNSGISIQKGSLSIGDNYKVTTTGICTMNNGAIKMYKESSTAWLNVEANCSIEGGYKNATSGGVSKFYNNIDISNRVGGEAAVQICAGVSGSAKVGTDTSATSFSQQDGWIYLNANKLAVGRNVQETWSGTITYIEDHSVSEGIKWFKTIRVQNGLIVGA